MAGVATTTRGWRFALDPTPAQERLLVSYCGAARFAYNWVLGEVRENLEVRATERAADIAETELTPALSWSKFALSKRWNATKDEVAPWWRDVSMHAFRSGVTSAADALKNWAESKGGDRAGRRVGFPQFKSRRRAVLSVSFVEINHQLSWLAADRHHVRLMLPQSSPDRELARRREHLAWIHTVESTKKLYRLVESGRASIQKVTIAKRGGRWWVSFQVRHAFAPALKPVKFRGTLIGVDAGVRHLATLSEPVPDLTDGEGYVANPRVLDADLRRLRRLDRRFARCTKGSKNQARLRQRRAQLHGRITQTRSMYLHRVTTILAGSFENVAIEDLNVAGMSHHKRRLGRQLADASLGELRRQLTYKTADRGTTLVVVDRFYPSSKTCSACGAVKAKLSLTERTFDCDTCGTSLDRDVNAALNIAREAARLLEQQDVAGLRPETENADPRPQKTRRAHARRAAIVRRAEPSSPTRTGVAQDLDGTLATASGSTMTRRHGNPHGISPICRT